MGTNYYWQPAGFEFTACKTCGHQKLDGPEKIHIGKSSVGWTFALHIYPKSNVNGVCIRSLDDWVKVWTTQKGHITDGEKQLTFIEMLMEIMCRNEFIHLGGDPYAISGPNGLMRRRIGGFVTGYGEGTWDHCVGEFS